MLVVRAERGRGGDGGGRDGFKVREGRRRERRRERRRGRARAKLDAHDFVVVAGRRRRPLGASTAEFVVCSLAFSSRRRRRE